jgi:WD40 repeat protein
MPDLQTRSIRSSLSTQHLQFDPNREPVSFTVTVYNDSDRFAAFRLQLQAPGVDEKQSAEWYRLVPAVSSKIPAGDQTRFQVEIFALPPTRDLRSGSDPRGFQGTMGLKTVVSSVDLDRGEEDRQDLQLEITGSVLKPPRLDLQAPALIEVKPGDPIELKLLLENRNRQPLQTTIAIDSPLQVWFEASGRKLLKLEAHQSQTIMLRGQVPEVALASAGDEPDVSLNEAEALTQSLMATIATGLYPLTVTAKQSQLPEVSASTDLKILPAGAAQFRVTPRESQVPAQGYRWLNPPQASAQFSLNLENCSNLPLSAQITIRDPHRKTWKFPWQKSSQLQSGFRFPWQSKSVNESELEVDPSLFEPEKISLPPLAQDIALSPAIQKIEVGAVGRYALTVNRNLPWLGWSRLRTLEVYADRIEPPEPSPELSLPELDEMIPIHDRIQTLNLTILPVIPLWLQIVSLLATILTALVISRLWSPGHTAPVNAVRFNGQGTEVISASNDQTIRQWKVQNDRLSSNGILLKEVKAIRAARYRPVNNDELAAGLENGEIRLQNLLSGTVRQASVDNADRVFDIVFSRDSRFLYSAHGSGLVVPWSIAGGTELKALKPLKLDRPFAIEAMTLLGANESLLAIAGRYNRLTLIDLPNRKLWELPYSPGGSENYIKSLATADQKPTLLASADNQGKIAIWDLLTCEKSTDLKTCQPLESWPGHGGKAVNAVSFTPDGCFLASAGSDGQVKLWPLDDNARRHPQFPEGKVLERRSQPINSVDVINPRDRILVVSGGDDHQVRLHPLSLKRNQTSRNLCNTQI